MAAQPEDDADARRAAVALRVLGALLALGALVLLVLGLLLVGTALDSGGPNDDPFGVLGASTLFLVPGAVLGSAAWWLLRRPRASR